MKTNKKAIGNKYISDTLATVTDFNIGRHIYKNEDSKNRCRFFVTLAKINYRCRFFVTFAEIN